MDKTRRCADKRRYTTKLEAEDAMFRVVKQTGVRLNRLRVYQCGQCRRFHFGHVTKTKR